MIVGPGFLRLLLLMLINKNIISSMKSLFLLFGRVKTLFEITLWYLHRVGVLIFFKNILYRLSWLNFEVKKYGMGALIMEINATLVLSDC